jgi:O-antigen ligase
VTAPAIDRTDFLGEKPRRGADGATLAVIFVVALLVIPARLVLRGIPLSLSPASVIAMLIGLTWLCAHFTSTLGVAKGRNVVRTGLFIYGVALLATYGYSTFAPLPMDELSLADHAIVLLVAVVGLGLGLVDGVRGADRLDFVLKAVVVCGAFAALVGVLQFLADFDLTKYLKLPMLRYSSEETLIEVERGGMRRVGGTMGHPIEFGVVCSMILPLAVHYAFRAKERLEPVRRWWICAGIIACGLMFSVSRSAVLGAAAAAVVLFIGWPTRVRLRALAVVAGFLVLMKFTVPGLLGNFYNLFSNAGTDDSVKWRTHDYPIALDEIMRHLWFGRGYGTWYAPKHQVFDNQYILTMVEGGVVGMVGFLIAFGVGIYAAIRVRVLSRDPLRRDLALAIVAGLFVPLVGSATFDLVSFKTAEGLSFLLIGAAGALLRFTYAGADPPRGRPMIRPRRPVR